MCAALLVKLIILHSDLSMKYLENIARLANSHHHNCQILPDLSIIYWHYASSSWSLSTALSKQTLLLLRLSLKLNWVSLGIINSIMLQASFSVQHQVIWCVIFSNSNDYLTHLKLWEWADELKIQLESLISIKKDELQVLQLLYSYHHLNRTDLDNLSFTDLIIYRVWLISETEPHNAEAQICWSLHKKWWLRKIIQNSIKGEVYERTQHTNDWLSVWNFRAVIVDKEKNVKFTDKPHITFNYSKVKENMSDNYLKLMSKVHNYLSDLWHKMFFQADIKHEYFSVVLHLKDWHLFAFTISEIEQLQPMQMSQRLKSAGFIMSELMNITLSLISESMSESSLMYSEFPGLSPVIFYVNDIFCSHEDFESQFTFL